VQPHHTDQRERVGRVLNPAQPVPLLRYEYDRGSSYEIDTGIAIALSALVPEAELHHPDHRFFQLVHLITEYAWVGIHHEICRVAAALEAGDAGLAGRLLNRCAGLADAPVRMVRLFEETLPQASMLAMREKFPPKTTGLDSPGMRNLRRASRAVWAAFQSAVDDAGTSLPQLTAIINRPASRDTPDVAHLALLSGVMSGLQRLDAKVLEWKQVHITTVWMLIGGHPAATDEADIPTSLRGRSVSYLERLAVVPLFPVLWRHTTAMFHAGLAEEAQ